MKKWLVLLCAFAVGGCMATEDTAKAPLQQSLRGDVSVPATLVAPDLPTYAGKPTKGTSVAQTFFTQPPVIPHKASYPITADKNGCVGCHKAGKAKMPETHLEGRKVVGNYYQCVVCHVPQAQGVAASRNNLF